MFQGLRKDSRMGKRIQGLVKTIQGLVKRIQGLENVERLDDDLVLSQHFKD